MTPAAADLTSVLRVLASWQHDGAALQLHPGDLGWHGARGPAATAAALRCWEVGGVVRVIGLLDGPGLIRLGVDPEAADDEVLAAQVARDLGDPDAGVLPAGDASAEARAPGALPDLLSAEGWTAGDRWTPFRHDLASRDLGGDGAREPDSRDPDSQGPGAPGPDDDLTVETVSADRPEQVAERAAVQRAGFPGSIFAPDHWRTLAAGPAYGRARCLLGRDATGTAVAVATVWSAGPGRPGLLEPVAVHPEHRGRGHGRGITRAALRALADLGASSALVCCESDNRAAVAAYASAGMRPDPEVADLARPA